MAAFRNMNLSKIILVISLALNLAVVGLVAGAWLGEGKERDRDSRGSDSRWSAGPYGRALSKEDRREMGERFRNGGSQELRRQRVALRDAGLEMVAALQAEPYDAAAVSEILDRQVAIGASQREIGNRFLLDQIGAMTPSERAAFAERLEEGLSRRRPPRD